MDFGQLCSQVGVITNRPDLINETQLAVRRATLYFHGLDTWFRDFNEKRFDFTAQSYTFTVDITKEFSNFRKLKYLKTLDSNTGDVKKDIKFMGPDNLWDEFGRYKKDVWYVAGTRLNFKTAVQETSFLVGYYSYPNLADAYDSWIAEQFPYAIIDEAGGRILQMLGQVDEGNKFVDPVKGTVITQHIPLMRANCIYPEA